MKNWVLTLLLWPLFIVGNPVHAETENTDLIRDDMFLCGSIRMGNFKNLQKFLNSGYDTSLEESYFKIRCEEGNDVLRMVTENPADRYLLGFSLQRYFEKKINKPELFSRIILSKVDTKPLLRQIDLALELISDNPELNAEFRPKLLKMKTKYLVYLEKHPVSEEWYKHCVEEAHNTHLKPKCVNNHFPMRSDP